MRDYSSQSAAMKRKWQDPEFRAQKLAEVRARAADPAWRAANREAALAQWRKRKGRPEGRPLAAAAGGDD